MNSKKSIYCNTMILSGLAMLGVGLFFSFGIGPALIAPGLFFVGFGTWGIVR